MKNKQDLAQKLTKTILTETRSISRKNRKI